MGTSHTSGEERWSSIHSASNLALPAFISSLLGSANLTLLLLPENMRHNSGPNDPNFIQAVKDWELLTNCIAPDLTISSNQKSWSTPLIKLAEERVMSAAPDQVGLACLIAAASPHSASFLQVVPMSAIGTRLDDTSLRIAIALRLGAPICAPHKCICGIIVDSSGTHGLSCRYSAGRHQRYSAINGLIKAALSSANIPSRLEPKGLNRDDGKRPDGMTTMPWKEGRCLVWDFTCPDTLAPSHLNKAVSGPGAVATDAESRKKAKYATLSTAYTFIPIAIETLGALGEDHVQSFFVFL